MMSEEHSENGRINEQGKEEINPETPDINSPRQSVTTPPDLMSSEEPTIEFFVQKGGGSETGSEAEGGSPRTPDNVSHHSRSYVTVSPSVSPDTSTGQDDAHFGTEQDAGEVVKPKPHPQTKLQQPCVLNGGSNGEEREEEGGAQRGHLSVEIIEREKVGVKSDAYISFKIRTKVAPSPDHFERESYEVWRRYRDFEWLREMLEKHHFTLIVPPLPGKQLVRYFDQKSEEFLDERQKALDKFLNRLAVHPFFSFNKHLKAFITAEPTEFTAFVAESSSSNRLLGAVASTVKMAANSFRLKNPNAEYAKESKYFEELGEKLGAMERVAIRLHSERSEFVSSMEELSSEIIRWSMNEPQMVDCIRRMGSCVENSTSSLKTLNENNIYSLMMTAREYQLYCASGVSAVRRRDGLQLEKEKAAEEREKKKKIHDDAANSGKLQKLPKLADDLQKAGVEAERTLDDLSIANEQLRVDVEKWKEAKDEEMGKLMITFSDNHINYHRKCFDEWEKVLTMLRDPKSTPAAKGGLKVSSEGIFSTLGATAPPQTSSGDGDDATPYSPGLFT